MPPRPGRRRLRCFATSTLVGAALASGCAGLQASQHYQRGTTALDQGDPRAAVAALEQAAALAPDASAIQNHLGIAYERSGRAEEARRAYERAIELDCDNAAARANLGALRGRAIAGASP